MAKRTYRGCLCRCGTGTWANYAPGHDARHVASLVSMTKDAHGTTRVVQTWQFAIRSLPTEALRTKFRRAMSAWAAKTLGAAIAEMQDPGWASWARVDRVVAWIDTEFEGIDPDAAAPVAAAMGMSRAQINHTRS